MGTNIMYNATNFLKFSSIEVNKLMLSVSSREHHEQGPVQESKRH
jgi:hypothetical protein